MKPALARWILGGVFLVASASKIPHPVDFAQSISNYALLPPSLIPLPALIVPWLEATAGLFLILGFLSSSSALVLGILSATFGLAVLTALARGLSIECGCFIGNEPISWLHPLFDLVLIGLAVYVLRQGPGVYAFDNRVVRPPETLAEAKVKRKRMKQG
jgi:uncharacterized membrane protein YphA (DoxX/SURF4 family)